MKVINLLKNIFGKRTIPKSDIMTATYLLYQAKTEADEMQRKDGHRRYVVYDPNFKKLIPITYDLHSGCLSWRYLRRRGLFTSYATVQQLQKQCFYYTRGKNKDNPAEGAVFNEKLKRWISYYSIKVKPLGS